MSSLEYTELCYALGVNCTFSGWYTLVHLLLRFETSGRHGNKCEWVLCLQKLAKMNKMMNPFIFVTVVNA